MADSWAVDHAVDLTVDSGEWRRLLQPSGPSGGARSARRTAWLSPHPAHGASKQVEMVSFGVDPQWGGLLFSLCSRHEDAGAVLGAGGGIIFPNILADPLAASSAAPGIVADFGNVLDVYAVSASSVWAIILETAKATGMVVLLGVGSLLFYRVFHSIRSRLHGLKAPGSRNGTGSRNTGCRMSPTVVRSLTSSGEDSDGESSEEEAVAAAATRGFETLAEDVEITGMYFGPGAAASMDDSTTSLPLAGPVSRGSLGRVPSRGPGGGPSSKAQALRRARRLSRRWDSDAMSMDDEARDADVSEGSRSPRTPPEERVSGRGGQSLAWRGASLYRRGWRGPTHGPAHGSNPSTPCSTTSTRSGSSSSSLSPEYPPHRSGHHHHRSRRHRQEVLSREDSLDGVLADHALDHVVDPREGVLRRGLRGLSREDSTDSLARRFMARDESYESLFACQQAGRRRSLSRNPSTDSLCYPPPRRLPRNESLDSLGFPRHGLTRGSSFDSTCSEMSLDVSLIAELEAKAEGGEGVGATLDQLEQLQREIDQLKSNCLSLDEEFETVRCNRNLPGMSSLLEVRGGVPGADPQAEDDEEVLAQRARARACFAGLYSLTRIASSPSLDLDQDLSDWDRGLSPAVKALPPTVNEEPLTSLEWDEEDMSYPDPSLEDSGLANDLVLGACAANISPVHDTTVHKHEGTFQRRQLSLDTSLRDSDSMLTSSMATFELDVDSEVGDPSAPIPDLEHEQEQHDEEPLPGDSSLSRDHLHLPLTETNTNLEHDSEAVASPLSPESWPHSEGVLTHSSSSSGVSVLSRSLSGLSDAWCSSAAMTPATPASSAPIAIGQRISIQEYVLKEWQGETKKAQTIIKGYSEIPGLLGLHTIRVIRGDNYCAVRGTVFQALARGLPLPSGHNAATRCSQLLSDPTGHWLRSWNFAGRLPYAGENVENGIRDCLLSIDSTVERLHSALDRESALANMLNADPWLDARLCEAAKLLMLVGALELKVAAEQGQPLPLFAELLFARDTSATPCDLMNNHLKNVGDTAGLEQVEMFLLGYSLGIRIRVVRPSAFGSQDYVCSYPDPEDIGVDMSEGVDNRRLVDLLAEDDRHYNVLLA